MGANILLALGAIVMFGTFLGSSNRLMIGNSQIASQNEYYIAALSYAQSVIDEAKIKSFEDDIYSTPEPGKEVKVSEVYHLGIESMDEKVGKFDTLGNMGYQSEMNFDDVDDYHGYSRLVNSPRAEGYHLFVSVNFVDDDHPTKVKFEVTDTKVMTVAITSPYFPKPERDGISSQDTLKLTYVFSR